MTRNIIANVINFYQVSSATLLGN